jgi:hypothetical protein
LDRQLVRCPRSGISSWGCQLGRLPLLLSCSTQPRTWRAAELKNRNHTARRLRRTLARPVSTTYLTLGMVRLVSATLVAITMSRVPSGGAANTRRCSLGGSMAYSGSTTTGPPPAPVLLSAAGRGPSHASSAGAIIPGAEKESSSAQAKHNLSAKPVRLGVASCATGQMHNSYTPPSLIGRGETNMPQ